MDPVLAILGNSAGAIGSLMQNTYAASCANASNALYSNAQNATNAQAYPFAEYLNRPLFGRVSRYRGSRYQDIQKHPEGKRFGA